MATGDCRKKLAILSWQVEGDAARAQVAIKECEDQKTEEFCCLTLANMSLRPGPCADGSLGHLAGRFGGTVEVLRRQDNSRGCFSGRWQLVADAPPSTPPAVLAAGELSGTVGCGTHRTPVTHQDCERCAVPEHYEGKLTGQVLVAGPLFGSEICATLAGLGPLMPDHRQRIVIEGVVIQCCPE
jgi:hypothetical protein